MSRIVLTATTAGIHTGPYTVYHTSISPSNIVRENVTRVELLSGISLSGSLYNTYYVESNDTYGQFTTGSVVVPTPTPTPTPTPGCDGITLSYDGSSAATACAALPSVYYTTEGTDFCTINNIYATNTCVKKPPAGYYVDEFGSYRYWNGTSFTGGCTDCGL